MNIAKRSFCVFSKRFYSSTKIVPKQNTIQDVRDKYNAGTPLSMCTAYDFITASWVNKANCDLLLVGDSLAMTSLGYDSTITLSLDEFKYHVSSVCRAEGPSLVVADMPFGTFESDISDGLKNAIDIMKLHSKVTSIKVEVGSYTKDKYAMKFIQELCSRGIPVMAHIGLTPQKVHSLGGYKVQGNKSLLQMQELFETAKQLQKIGCWSIVIECVPHKMAQFITSKLSIPTIGIGAGNGTSGQVLVISDLLGMQGESVPKFVKQTVNMRDIATKGLKEYITSVEDRTFPEKDFHTFKVKDDLWNEFLSSTKDK
ncbi:hypothetical protein N7582_001261 [Saccharomyces uvarum]|uniref:3-methyl-2-oxobutanoate hydroxymethyltransferase n=1 Tax=Saccharomyces uvarum TaxID=230603 RepID=A0AA35NRB4_SACUV|nr:hypothetical protein N7582_001261 [Saccharomyces uvarum]CAI4058999.1 hypothetical protein SUVC_04G3920 [Saccharomyces uvarum]